MSTLIVILKASEGVKAKTMGEHLEKAGHTVDFVIVPDDRYEEAMGLLSSDAQQELHRAFEYVAEQMKEEQDRMEEFVFNQNDTGC